MAAKLVRKCLLLMQVLVSFLVVPPAFALRQHRLKSLTVIKEVNRKGPYIGLITVYPPEENAFLASGAFKPHKTHPFVDLSGGFYFILSFFFPPSMFVEVIVLVIS
jgi:hypothetical protein